MNEIDSLIKRAKKYLETAQKLIVEEDYESSVSRSYYAITISKEEAQEIFKSATLFVENIEAYLKNNKFL